MKRLSIFTVILSAIFLAAPTASSHAAIIIPAGFSFTKDLKLGDNISPDIPYLQNVLNMTAVTRVASTGPGSDNELTSSFGLKTKDAVIRFQSFYAADVLTPAGLTSPTGVVGALTRTKLNQILQQLNLQNSNTAGTGGQTTSTQSAASATGGQIYNPYYAISTSGSTGGINVYGISTYKVIPGQIMSVFGQGFDKDLNTIQIGSEIIKNLPSSSSNTIISFAVPKSLPTGQYAILVSNKYGLGSSGALVVNVDASNTALSKSNSSSSNPAILTPILSSVSPVQSKFLTQVIIIAGDNFSADNTIQTNLGNIYHQPSTNGKMLHFTVGSLPYYSKAVEMYKGQAINLVIRVSNQHGISKEQVVHVINLPASGNIADASPSNTAEMLASTANYAKYQSSTNYSLYVPYNSNTAENSSSLQSLFGLVSAMDFGGYGSLFRTSTTSFATASGTSSVGGATSPYTTNTNLSALNSADANIVTDYFGGLIMKTVRCTSDNTILLYVRDYAHQYRTYGLTLDPQTTKVNAAINEQKGSLNVGAYISGKFNNKGRACVVGSSNSANTGAGASSNQPQSLVDVSVGTIEFVQKL